MPGLDGTGRWVWTFSTGRDGTVQWHFLCVSWRNGRQQQQQQQQQRDPACLGLTPRRARTFCQFAFSLESIMDLCPLHTISSSWPTVAGGVCRPRSQASCIYYRSVCFFQDAAVRIRHLQGAVSSIDWVEQYKLRIVVSILVGDHD